MALEGSTLEMRKFVGANVLRRSTDGKTTSNESWNGRQA